MRLKPDGLLAESPRTCAWWTPRNSEQEVACDLCQSVIEHRPIPVLRDGSALCPACFAQYKSSASQSLAATARQEENVA